MCACPLYCRLPLIYCLWFDLRETLSTKNFLSYGPRNYEWIQPAPGCRSKRVFTVFQQKKVNASAPEQRRCAGHVPPQGKGSVPGDRLDQNHSRAGKGWFLLRRGF